MLLFRIGIEERMLVEEFGVEYEEYMRRTKKLIPYVY
jgi:protein-S-isoprenylcysteine O-methyltransferase Ste14